MTDEQAIKETIREWMANRGYPVMKPNNPAESGLEERLKALEDEVKLLKSQKVT